MQLRGRLAFDEWLADDLSPSSENDVSYEEALRACMPNSTRGFASMPPEKVRAIAGRGGKAAHAKGVAHRWTRNEASSAGRKGGLRRKQPNIPDLKGGHR
jgi:general stress protein YciG